MHRLILTIIILPLLLSCASAPAPRPDWVELGMDAVYPPDAFIAQEGRGPGREIAETNAMGALARFFISQVESNSRSTQSWIRGGGGEARLDAQTTVRSTAQLSGVRYSVPWYNPGVKEYLVIAFINRDEGWTLYEPEIRKESDAFLALYKNAETENAPLKKFLAYKTAQNFIRREEFINTMSYGGVLHPEKLEALVKDTREAIPGLSAKINDAKIAASVYIDCPVDYESVIVSALTRLLGAEGFTVTNNKNNAGGICSASVTEGYQQLEAGNFYYPAIDIVINDITGESLFSYSVSAPRQGAASADVAKRRAYNALAGELEKSFSEQFNKAVD